MDRGRKPLEAILEAVLCEEGNSPSQKGASRGSMGWGTVSGLECFKPPAVRARVPYVQRTLRRAPLCSSPLPARVPLIGEVKDLDQPPPTAAELLLRVVVEVVIGVVSGKCEVVLLRLRVIVRAAPAALFTRRAVLSTATVDLLQPL
jgi:hypothetical protein